MKTKTATKRAARHVNKRHASRRSQGTSYPERQPRRVRLGFGLHAGWCDIDYAIEHGRLRSYRKPVVRGAEGNGVVVRSCFGDYGVACECGTIFENDHGDESDVIEYA